MKERFKLAVDLFSSLGQAKLSSGQSLRRALSLDGDVSLWDIVASYMVLYRFPLLFASDGSLSLSDKVRYYLRPYRGWAAGLKDSFISSPGKSVQGCARWDCADTEFKILFLGFVPTFYRDVLAPIAEALAETNKFRVIVLRDQEDQGSIFQSRKRILFQSIWDHSAADSQILVLSWLRQIRSLKKELFKHPDLASLTEHVPGQGRAFALKREFKWLFWRAFPRLLPLVAVAAHILDQHRPDLIITADDADQRCRIYSLLARKRRVPCLLVQQGLTSRDYPEWLFFTPSVVAAMGQNSRSDMMTQNVAPETIIVTGHPGFDYLAHAEPDCGIRLRERFRFLPENKIILFASQPYYVGVFSSSAIRQKMIQAILEVCGLFPELKLVIKPHPGEDVREFKKLIERLPYAALADKADDIAPLIKGCDVLITFFSTAALQAIYSGKPVINVEFPGCGGLPMYADSGATWVARSREELIACIRKLTDNNSGAEIRRKGAARDRFLREMVHIPDGKAALRISELIPEILARPTLLKNDNLT